MWCWLILSVSVSHSCQDPVNDLQFPQQKPTWAKNLICPHLPSSQTLQVTPSFSVYLRQRARFLFCFSFPSVRLIFLENTIMWKNETYNPSCNLWNIQSKLQSTLIVVNVPQWSQFPFSSLTTTVRDHTTSSPTPHSSSLLTGCSQVFLFAYSFTNPFSFCFPFLLLQTIITWIGEENAAQRKKAWRPAEGLLWVFSRAQISLCLWRD